MRWLLAAVLMLRMVGTTGYGSNPLGPTPPWPDGCVIITAGEWNGKNEQFTLISLYRVDRDGKAVHLKSDKPLKSPRHPYFAPDGKDGWLYFDDDGRIWAMNANGHVMKLTSDPWGLSCDGYPYVSIQQKHLLFETDRTGEWRTALAENGLTQGPGYGIDLPLVYPAWSATHPDRLWYWKRNTTENTITFAEYDVVAKADTGRTIILKEMGYPLCSISISPNGALLTIPRWRSDDHIAVFDFAGQQRVEFSVGGRDPTWNDRNTVVFADPEDPRAFYRGSLVTGQVTRILVQGLPENDRIINLVAWPGSP